jgi:hypothetical protein
MREVSITNSRSKPYRFEPPLVGKGYALLLYIAAVGVCAVAYRFCGYEKREG